MLTGPKKLEYFALIAPPGKKALYLGYVNIPVGIGAAVGGFSARRCETTGAMRILVVYSLQKCLEPTREAF